MSTRKPGTESKTLKKDDMTVTNNDTDKTSASSEGANGGGSLLPSKDFPGCLLTPIKEHIIHLTREMQWPASREHDYAKTPEKIIPRGAISDHVTDISKPSKNKSSPWKKLENKKLEQALLNCHSELYGMRDMLLCHSRMAVTQHYREILSLQMSLILEQQQQIQQKEAELVALRQEKQQLESRIERMDRRMSVMQRRSRLANGNEEEEDESLDRSNANRVSSDAQTEKTTPTSLEQPSVTKSLKSSNSSESKVQLTANKPTAKRKLQSEGKNSDKKKPKLQSSELRTTFEYNGIGSCNTEVSFVNKEDKILIPSWRLSSPTPGQSPKVKSEVKTEDTSDDMYLKRHRKYEESERKRKRWDLQRARTLIQHQYLLDRYKRIHEKTLKPTNQKASKPNIDTFLPKPQEIKEIEISDTVPLMAFGCTIPYSEPRYVCMLR